MFSDRIADAEHAVRRAVAGRELTQEQFDAAVAFVYNTGAHSARALAPANYGRMDEVARNIRQYVHGCPRDRQGHTVGPYRVSAGLVQRRAREAAAFNGRMP
ncbi:hypothetical protein ASG87_17315 [Frateuria sp. Soil773]|nr:hypothetical protein ASG87_17315 [Frateuria sp. Soil773]